MLKWIVATLTCSLCFLLGCEAGAPKFFCPDNQTSYWYERDANLTCSVTGSPAVIPGDMKVWWYLSEPGNDTDMDTVDKVELKGGESFGRYSAVAEEGGDHETIMTIFFERVFPQMFRKYYFVAENSHGTSEHSLELLRDESREPSDGAAQMVLSVVMVAVTALLHLAAH